MGADGYIADGEQIVLGMVVREGADSASCDQSQGGIDDDGEFDIAVFVFAELEFRPLLGRFIKCLVLFLGVLHLLLYCFEHFAIPLHAGKHFGVVGLDGAIADQAVLVDMLQQLLIVFASNVSGVVRVQSWALIFDFLEKEFQVIRIHRDN